MSQAVFHMVSEILALLFKKSFCEALSLCSGRLFVLFVSLYSRHNLGFTIITTNQ